MALKDYLEPCKKVGHPNAKFLAIYAHLDNSFDSDYYCPDCKKAFTRSSSLEEIAKYKSIMETKSL